MNPVMRLRELLKRTAFQKFSVQDFRFVSTVSSLFQPLSLPPKDAETKKEEIVKSQRLLGEMGVVRQASPGMFTILPLGLRSLAKLKKIIDEEMQNAGCQKLQLPFLTPSGLWKITGRLDTTGPELLSVTDRHRRSYILSPTHEEAITDLVASLHTLTYRQLPLRLYQITSKFRDEIKPRFGLLRGREFIMKDLYTFDKSTEMAQETYAQICNAYDSIFKRLGVPFVKVTGSTGNIGGLSSHEYHYPSAIGEDKLILCSSCDYGANVEVFDGEVCPNCGSQTKESKGIEVGHTFLLGTKYAQALNASFNSDCGSRNLCQMGCYGIGVSRILAASVEVLSNENEIRWPQLISPYRVCVIAPKGGSKEDSATPLAYFVADELNKMDSLVDDVILDDRSALTVGKKIMEAKRVGYPYIVVAGKKSVEQLPKLEVHDLDRNLQLEVTVAETLDYFKKCIK